MITLPVLKTIDVAKMLQVDPVTVRRWCKDGSIKYYRVGKQYRFFPEDIQMMIKSSETNDDNA